MKVVIKAGIFICSLLCCFTLYSQDRGEEIYTTYCVACHTINEGVLLGPDLADIQEKRSEEWLISFIQSSQTMIENEDPDAVAVFEEYNQLVMPDQPFSDEEVKMVLTYIAAKSAEGGAEGEAKETPEIEITQEDIETGKKLFVGELRLAGGGPACNACHHVKNDDVMGGGALAKDITTSVSMLSSAGVSAILAKPPFPVMKQAYKDKDLTEEEVFTLTAFLQHTDEVHEEQEERDYGARLLFTGLGGGIVILGLFSGLWHRRKKKSVNDEVFRRQISSE